MATSGLSSVRIFPGTFLIKEGYGSVAHPSNLIDLQVYHLLPEGSDHDSIVVPFNFTEHLLDEANDLSSFSSHSKHLHMASCAPPRHPQLCHGADDHHPGSDMDKQNILDWLPSKTKTRLSYLNKTRNPKTYLAGRLP